MLQMTGLLETYCCCKPLNEKKRHRWVNRAYRFLTRFTEASASNRAVYRDSNLKEISVEAYGSQESTQKSTEPSHYGTDGETVSLL